MWMSWNLPVWRFPLFLENLMATSITLLSICAMYPIMLYIINPKGMPFSFPSPIVNINMLGYERKDHNLSIDWLTQITQSIKIINSTKMVWKYMIVRRCHHLEVCSFNKHTKNIGRQSTIWFWITEALNFWLILKSFQFQLCLELKKYSKENGLIIYACTDAIWSTVSSKNKFINSN